MIDASYIQRFPSDPGVYLMHDSRDKVVYVGKAKNLRQRLKQYVHFQDTRPMIPHLMAEVERIEVIVLPSEKDALLLENTLIKQHQPKYNALLKDDKSYISLKVNHKHAWPMIRLVRYKGRPKRDGLYFGPYASADAARQTLDLLNRLFPLRECSDRELASRKRPCILYDMKRCCAPCVRKVSEDAYRAQVRRTIQFLKGKDRDIVKDLYVEMQAASDALDFEKAGRILQVIRSLEKTIERQHVAQAEGVDRDVLGLFREGEDVVLTQLLFRGGKMIGSESHHFSGVAQEDSAIVESFILQQYDHAELMPEELLLGVELEARGLVEDLLYELAGRKVRLHRPQKGDKVVLLRMAEANSKVAFESQRDQDRLREKRLIEMKERFHLNNFPRRMECFDTSNISGTEPVASLVAFTDGEPDKARYRKYKIRQVEGIDDYAYMAEALRRRLERGKTDKDLPDLLIVDGGKGHLNMALKLLDSLDITTVDVIGLAKEAGRHDKGMSAEQVFLPGRKDPILLGKYSSVLFLLQRIRDEAHRVAISFHRQRRSKAIVRSELDLVPGIGPARRKALLKHFGSLKRVKAASMDELTAVPGISRKQAEQIQQALKQS